MILEERIPADNEIAAKEVVQYLKKEGISARIVTEPRLSVALILSGNYENLGNFIRNRHENDRKENETRECDPGGDNTFWENCHRILEEERASVVRILSGHKTGDMIGEIVHRVIFLKEQAEEGYDPEVFSRELSTIRTLMSNKVCEITAEGFVLSQEVSADEITLFVGYDSPFPPEQEVCDQFSITCIRHFRGDVTYVVQTGPEIILIEDFESFMSALAGAGVDVQSLMSLAQRFMAKLRITQEIISSVFEAESISLDELRILFVDEIAPGEGEGHLQDRFGLSPEYIDALVSDLRKLNLIKGKDSRLKPVNLTEKRKNRKQ
jgi:hypothetical protein